MLAILVYADDVCELDIEGDTSFTYNSASVSGCESPRHKGPRKVCAKLKFNLKHTA